MRWQTCVALLGLAGCSRPPAPVIPAELEVDWTGFRWAQVAIGPTVVERAAILLEGSATAEGGRRATLSLLQLDFGFAQTATFGIPLRRLGFDSVGAADQRILRATLDRLGDRDDSTGTAARFRLGTTGLLFYGLKGLLIDQVTQRVGAPRAGRPLPAQLMSRMTWSEAREDVGRLLVPLVWGADRLGGLWYDPGSSLVPLLVNSDTWRLLTGRRGNEPDNRRLVFPLRQDSLVLEGAPVVGSLRLGAITLGRPVAYHVGSGPAAERPDRFPPGVVGVIGNQLFEPYRLVYVNVAAKRLGVLK